jgi:hypothetical protein
VAAVGFACVACTRQESYVRKKAPHSSPSAYARSSRETSGSADVGQDDSRGKSTGSRVQPSIGDGETPLPQGTIIVPPSLLQSFGQYPEGGYLTGSDVSIAANPNQFSPTDQTPEPTAAPLPSSAWAGLVLMCGLGLAMLIRAHRTRSKVRQTAAIVASRGRGGSEQMHQS